MSSSTTTLTPQAEEANYDAHGGTGRGMDAALLGVMLFIASEVMFFAALFGVYFNIRATAPVWPPEGTEFITPVPWAILITIVLVTSSFTMQWATMRIRKGDRTGLNRGILITLILGLSFFVLVGIEYFTLVTKDDFGINSGVYGTMFYTMTGFHAAHVLGGVVGMTVVLGRGLSGQFSAKHHSAVEAIHYYWHFVDIVWIFLFIVIYVLR
ncbi:MAG: cytochrome c oxidase subunit 3 [Chloroflexota bacterium]